MPRSRADTGREARLKAAEERVDILLDGGRQQLFDLLDRIEGVRQ